MNRVNLHLLQWGCFGLIFCLALATASPAQTFTTFTTLAVFDGTNGGLPSWPLIQGTDGNFYGSTGFGGTGNSGTIFTMTPLGDLTTLQSIEYSHLAIQATDRNFYGTTPYSGPSNAGTIFKMTAEGELTTLYDFCAQPNCTDGGYPFGGVIQGTDGNFYGTTTGGGTSNGGTVFKVTPEGKLTTLCNLDNGAASTGLIEGSDGNFYGTTSNGGAGYGTIFEVTPKGTLITLHNFDLTDGKFPYDKMIQGKDGNFYGTTYSGGANDPTACDGTGCGTIFRITSQGKLTTLYSFCSQSNCTDGQWPSGSLVQGSDGNFYGTTEAGGAYGETCPFGICGTLFELTGQGKLTILHSFAGTDGSSPYAGLLQSTDGAFYGNTEMGGDFSCGEGYGCGTVFSLSLGLAPFVATNPAFGKAETKVIILGNKLTGATAVTFNGASATFKVVSSTEILTNVPKAATTGLVTVTVPSGTLTSNTRFVVP